MFTLESIVPWGRSFDEYQAMFALHDGDFTRRILGCGDGPASFNAVATALGGYVCSCDPLYRHTAVEIRARIAATYGPVLGQFRENLDQFIWHQFGTVEQFGQYRLAAMEVFLSDYGTGQAEGRYRDESLPTLSFGDRSFDLALCSHLLFLYEGQLDQAFHIAAVLEMCRVADECRVFPLLALQGTRSTYVDPVIDAAQRAGFVVSIERVQYEFARGGNEQMRIRRPPG
jgi:hypothetical protein